MISDYKSLIKKMKKSIWQACHSYSTATPKEYQFNTYFNISIDKNPIGRIEFKVKIKKIKYLFILFIAFVQ